MAKIVNINDLRNEVRRRQQAANAKVRRLKAKGMLRIADEYEALKRSLVDGDDQ